MSKTYRKASKLYSRWKKVKINSKVKDGSFINHCNGSNCPWCIGNRLHKHQKKRSIREELNELD